MGQAYMMTLIKKGRLSKYTCFHLGKLIWLTYLELVGLMAWCYSWFRAETYSMNWGVKFLDFQKDPKLKENLVSSHL